MKDNEVKHLLNDSKKAREELGWVPEVNLRLIKNDG